MEQELDNSCYGEINRIQINSQIYQIQEAEFEDEKFFFIRRSEEVVRMIMQDEKNEWKPDCDISEEVFEQVMKWINRYCSQFEI
jgi:hypothetical protein